MSESHNTDEESIDEAASEWLFEREEGFTPERAKVFDDWCKHDVRHSRAFARVERTLALLNEMPAVRAPLEVRIASIHEAPVPLPKRQPLFPRMAWAAGWAALLAVGCITWWAVPRTSVGEHYATNTAAQSSLVLPDGSVVDINVGSEIVVQFTPRERRLALSKGEAHFQVAHDSTRPFIVTAGDITVRAVGTAFDVRLGRQAVDVLVDEGKVQLGRNIAQLSMSSPATPSLLYAGERAQVSRDNNVAWAKTEKVDAGQIRAMLTWQTSMTKFRDVPLRDVVARFNRRNAIQLVLGDADLGERKIGGIIALDQVDLFVRLLARDGDIVAEKRSANEILLHRGQ